MKLNKYNSITATVTQDYQRHIAVLKESLAAKEEHYNMLQTDVEELRARLDEKNRLLEKKTQNAMQAQQERNRLTSESTELKDHMDIKDRKIVVLQRKVNSFGWCSGRCLMVIERICSVSPCVFSGRELGRSA